MLHCFLRCITAVQEVGLADKMGNCQHIPEEWWRVEVQHSFAGGEIGRQHGSLPAHLKRTTGAMPLLLQAAAPLLLLASAPAAEDTCPASLNPPAEALPCLMILMRVPSAAACTAALTGQQVDSQRTSADLAAQSRC